MTNWQAIKMDYITGHQNKSSGGWELPTLVELAELHQVSYGTLSNKAREEEWKVQRDDYWEEIGDSVKKIKAKEIIEKALEFDDQCGEVAQYGLKHLLSHFHNWDENDKRADTDLLERLARTLVQFQKAGRLVFGEPTDHHRHEGIKFVQVNVNNPTADQEEVVEEYIPEEELES